MRSELLIGPNLTIPQIRKPQGHVAPLRPTRSGVSRIVNRRTPPLTSRRGPREHCGFVGSHPILTRFHGPGSGLTLVVTPLPYGCSGRARPRKIIWAGRTTTPFGATSTVCHRQTSKANQDRQTPTTTRQLNGVQLLSGCQRRGVANVIAKPHNCGLVECAHESHWDPR